MTEDFVLLTVKEAHDLTNLPVKALYRLCERGELATRRSGRTVYIRRKSLLRWVEGEENQQWSDDADAGKVLSMNEKMASGSRSSGSTAKPYADMHEQKPKPRPSGDTSLDRAVRV